MKQFYLLKTISKPKICSWIFSPCESAELGQEHEKNSGGKKKVIIKFTSAQAEAPSNSENLVIKLEQLKLNIQNRLKNCIANALSGVQ